MGMKGAFTELKKYQLSWGVLGKEEGSFLLYPRRGENPNKTKERTPIM